MTRPIFVPRIIVILKRFQINLFFKFLGEGAARFSSLLFYAIGARLLGAEEFGLFSLAFSYAFVLVVFIEMGMNAIVTREIARDKDHAGHILGALLPIKLLVIPLGLLGIHLFTTLQGMDPRMVLLCDLMCLAAFGTGFWELISASYSGMEKMGLEAGFKTFWKIGALVLACVGFWVYPSVEGFVVGMGLGQLISTFAAFLYFSRNVRKIKLHWDPGLFSKIFWVSAPLFLSWIFIFLYDNQDMYFLSWLEFSNAEMGYFSSSAKLIDALRPLPVLLIGAVFPILSEASVKDRGLYVKVIQPVLRHSILFLFPFVLIFSFSSEWIVRILFGADFIPSAPVFTIAIWGFWGIFINHLLVNALIILDGQKHFLQGAVLAALTNALFCYLLFSKMGLVGGAYALVISEIAWFILNISLVSQILKGDGFNPKETFGKPLFLGALCGFSYFLLSLHFPNWIGLGTSLLFFVLGAKVFSLIDWTLLKRLRTIQ